MLLNNRHIFQTVFFTGKCRSISAPSFSMVVRHVSVRDVNKIQQSPQPPYCYFLTIVQINPSVIPWKLSKVHFRICNGFLVSRDVDFSFSNYTI